MLDREGNLRRHLAGVFVTRAAGLNENRAAVADCPVVGDGFPLPPMATIDRSLPRSRTATTPSARNTASAFSASDQSTVAMGGNENLSPMTQRVDGGTIFVQAGGPRDENAGKVPPQVTLAVEHYNRLVRVLDRDVPVKMELDIQAQFHDEDRHERHQRRRRDCRAPTCQRDRAARRASRQLALVDRRDRQRRRRRGHDGSDAHPQDRRAPSRGAPSGSRSGAARSRATWVSRLRAGTPRRCGKAQAGTPEALRLLQPGQRHRTHPRRLDAGQRGDHADLRAVDRTAARSRRQRARAAIDIGIRLRAVRRHRHSRVPVHSGSARVQLADPPLQHGHARPRAARRSRADVHRPGELRLQHGDAQLRAATQSDATAGDASNQQ